jgi:SHS2 domain-containing protein
VDAGEYGITGRGSDLGITVSGPNLPACLRAAVRAFAAALADVPEDLERVRIPLRLPAGEPPDLLVDLLDELIALLDARGQLGVELHDVRVAGGLEATLSVVALGALDVHGVAPKAATWHGLRLEPGDGGWHGTVMLDL